VGRGSETDCEHAKRCQQMKAGCDTTDEKRGAKMEVTTPTETRTVKEITSSYAKRHLTQDTKLEKIAD